MKKFFLNNLFKKITILVTITLFLYSCSKPQKVSYDTDSSFESASKQFYMVDLRGEVMRPGLYKIESGSLVNDVIELAGGFTKNADTTSLNLVQVISTNIKITILSINTNTSLENVSNDKINLNSCTKEQIMTVPKLGEAKAKAIIDYRNKVGAFSSIEELLKVSGIGDTLYQEIKVYFTI